MVERHTTKPKNITCMIVHSAERFVFFYNLPNVVCCLWNHATETSGSRRRVRDRPGIAITQLAKRREETDVVGVNSWLDKESGWNKTPRYFSHTLSRVSFLRWEEDMLLAVLVLSLSGSADARRKWGGFVWAEAKGSWDRSLRGFLAAMRKEEKTKWETPGRK